MSAKNISYILISLAIVIVISTGALAVGYELGVARGEQLGWQKAAVKVAQSNPLFAEPTEVRMVNGRIKTIEKDYLLVQTSPTTINPLASGQTMLRKVIINQDTKFLLQRMKSGAQIKEEMDKGTAVSPLLFESIKKIDFKINDSVMIGANENIKDKAEFIANQIILVMM